MPPPYPTPSSPAATAVMRGNRKRDTKPELLLRSALHRQGLRYRLGKVVVSAGLRVQPDITFPARKVAVFVDGCWWHRCPTHGVTPRSNTEYWLPKLARNVDRDRRVDEALAAGGWLLIRAWEHEIAEDAGAVVIKISESLRARSVRARSRRAG
jgi:DNA mismatch endonuclease, patch repair protein